jgi:hypothetical protein
VFSGEFRNLGRGPGDIAALRKIRDNPYADRVAIGQQHNRDLSGGMLCRQGGIGIEGCDHIDLLADKRRGQLG